VIPNSRFPAEPWVVRETSLSLADLAQSESLFALSNGHIGLRGNLDEGDPFGLPGTYLNSFYEARPLPYAEAGFGYPETGQTILNVTNGKLIRLLVDDEPFDMRYGDVLSHERVLDLRDGVLRREVLWASPSGQRVRVRTRRLVSLTQRSIVGIHYEVEPVDAPARLVLQSELVANEHVPAQSGDPRVAAAVEQALQPEEHHGSGTRALLIHMTRSSELRVAAAMEHVIEAGDNCRTEMSVHEDWARLMVAQQLQPGQKLSLTKFVAYGWSSQRSLPALRDQVEAALLAASRSGWKQLVEDQRTALHLFWEGADVEIDGNVAIQQAVRFALFHVLQASTRAEQRAIPAKGLTGPGYDGHAFWDTESFVLPVLTATAPHAAADALKWRAAILPLAVERAETLGLRGAAFPWRTIRGQETSGYWPAGTAAFHVNADVAVAAARYVRWTDDRDFERDYGMPIYVETARLWRSLGYPGHDGCFHIDGVTGPDEYSAIVDDNVYTNLMARENLLAAADAAERYPEQAEALDVEADEIQGWRHAAETMSVPYDEDERLLKQDKDFTDHQTWDFAETAATGTYPLLLHYPYFEIYRKQVVKQADLVLALHWAGDQFSLEQKARAFAYYEALTVRDSSLSASTQAVVAAEVGQMELAYDYLAEAALIDLHDLQHNTRNGLHIASLAGTWLALVAGLGGMRDFDDRLSFHPQLPPGWRGMRFRVRWRGRLIQVGVSPDAVTYELIDGSREPIRVFDADTALELEPGVPVTRPVQRVEPLTPRPRQPDGRAPVPADELTAAAVS